MKYEIGDLVSKPVTGICKIEDILYLNLTDEKNNKLYYLIKPIEDEKDKIYVPVSNSDSRLRLCLTKEEAWNLIKRIPENPTAWVNNEKLSQDISCLVKQRLAGELELLLQESGQKEEERFRLLDETIRSFQKAGQEEAAATKVPFFKRKRFGRGAKKLFHREKRS